LGVLTKTFPLDKVRAVVAAAGKTNQRQRDLPAHVIVYYVIALTLYMQVSYREVLRCLLEGVKWLLGPEWEVKVSGKSGISLSVAAKKGTKMAAKWSPARGAVRSEPFPLLRSVVRNGPEPSRARRCWARRSEPLTARTVLR
jgi:hypothetical protein